jgi:hypothetical protein
MAAIGYAHSLNLSLGDSQSRNQMELSALSVLAVSDGRSHMTDNQSTPNRELAWLHSKQSDDNFMGREMAGNRGAYDG